MKRLAISLLAIFCATTAHATLVVADADDFPEFTDIRNAFLGITLSVDGSPGALVRRRSGRLPQESRLTMAKRSHERQH